MKYRHVITIFHVIEICLRAGEAVSWRLESWRNWAVNVLFDPIAMAGESVRTDSLVRWCLVARSCREDWSAWTGRTARVPSLLTTSLKVRVQPGEALLLLELIGQRGYKPRFSSENLGFSHLATGWLVRAMIAGTRLSHKPLCCEPAQPIAYMHRLFGLIRLSSSRISTVWAGRDLTAPATDMADFSARARIAATVLNTMPPLCARDQGRPLRWQGREVSRGHAPQADY